MARSYAPLYTSIWLDKDFKALTGEAQRLYMVAFSQSQMNYCGVVSFTARRWAGYAADTTPEGVMAAVDELAAAGMVVLDEDTEELWVRSFIRHNKVLEQPKVLCVAVRDFATVLSSAIQRAVQMAYPEAFGTPPDTPPDTPAEEYDEGYSTKTPARVGKGSGLGRGSGQGSGSRTRETREGNVSLVLAGSTLDAFGAWWETYPKRNGKRLGRSTCETLWSKLSPDNQLLAAAGTRHYATACDTGLTIAKDPERFLKGRVWVDWQEPATATARGARSNLESNLDVLTRAARRMGVS